MTSLCGPANNASVAAPCIQQCVCLCGCESAGSPTADTTIMRQRTWWQKSWTRWCWRWCSPQVHRLTFHDNTQLIWLNANKANNDPNTTRHTVGNRSMWKKWKTKSDRNGKKMNQRRKKKNFQSFSSLCCLTDDNSDLFQNCWSQQQGKNTIFVWQQFPPHTSAETSIRLKLCSCDSVNLLSLSTSWFLFLH